MAEIRLTLNGEAATARLGELLARLLLPRLKTSSRALPVYLEGDLGVGKTTLARGLITAAGFRGVVRSPTYTLVEAYPLPEGRICHFDLYRLADPGELELMGARDYFAAGALCLIEWPERARGFLPPPAAAVSFSLGEQSRGAVIKSQELTGEELARISSEFHEVVY